MREAIEERFQVPAISVTGTDDWLGEWTFALPQGSMTDEPIFWAHLHREGAATREVGVLIEQSLIGETLHPQLPQGVRAQRASASSPRSRSRRPRRTSSEAVRGCTRRSPTRSSTAASASAWCT